jgi:CRISPR-associated exonuclease Cas4
MLASGELPPPSTDARRCPGCSLRERCQPEAWRQWHGEHDPRADLFEPGD